MMTVYQPNLLSVEWSSSSNMSLKEFILRANAIATESSLDLKFRFHTSANSSQMAEMAVSKEGTYASEEDISRMLSQLSAKLPGLIVKSHPSVNEENGTIKTWACVLGSVVYMFQLFINRRNKQRKGYHYHWTLSKQMVGTVIYSVRDSIASFFGYFSESGSTLHYLLGMAFVSWCVW
jgi:hypothetical protein